MRVHIAAIGRLGRGPEAELVADYQSRFDKTGRQQGLGPLSIREMEAKKSGMEAESVLLDGAVPKGAFVVALDERGRVMTSPMFADHLGSWRDQGRGDVCFLIGGADGLHPELRAQADFKLSFGAMVWPHALARVMLCEQLYRAASILAGSPYHRV
ncbi:MAG: 23S rRNA (pseudouridine(1915)-N(3))-methyltransferase RlmH [Pseudomonadota bacterium]